MDRYEQLERIKRLRDEGVLSEFEFEVEKAKILRSNEEQAQDQKYAAPPGYAPPGGAGGTQAGGGFSTAKPKPWGMEPSIFHLLLHLSVFAGCVIPVGGLALPLVMWLTTKDQHPEADAHGRVVMNWLLSAIVYTIGGLFLALFFIGIPLLIALAICSVVFSIIGAIKANDGEVWPYPLSIPFFTVRGSERA